MKPVVLPRGHLSPEGHLSPDQFDAVMSQFDRTQPVRPAASTPAEQRPSIRTRVKRVARDWTGLS
jgi:hypothetical protein